MAEFFKKSRFFIIASLLVSSLVVPSAYAAAVPRLVFPVIGSSSYSNDFNAPRSNGTHRATDIIASKRQKVVSASDGIIQYVTNWENAGYSVQIKGGQYTYSYYHLNNDNPGTDDGKAGYMGAFAPDMKPGNPVVKGQMLGYVGDSGNAEGTVSHLHFEIYKDSTAVNPYSYLNSAVRISKPAQYPQLGGEFLPYGPGGIFRANISDGQFNGDADRELVTAVGGGAPPHVLIFDKTNTRIGSFFAYVKEFRGGVDVASVNLDGDPEDEVVTGAGAGGGPQVKIFNKDGSVIGGFFAFDKSDRNGIAVSGGDINNDGTNEIVVAPLKNGKPLVRIYNLNGVKLGEFYAYSESFRNGIDVAVGDVDNDGKDEIITSPLYEGNSLVRIFNENGVKENEFYAYGSSFYGGVRLDAGNASASNAGDEIGVVPAVRGGPHAKIVTRTGVQTSAKIFLEDWWRGGYDIAIGENFFKAAAGTNRRFSVR